MVQIRKIVLISVVAIAILGTAGTTLGLRASQQKGMSLDQIVSGCEQNIGSDGFGHVTVSGGTVQRQTAEFSVPCKIRVQAGAVLSINKVQITSKNLLIENGTPDEAPVRLHISNSVFKSIDGGFQISLTSNNSKVLVQKSQFDYPLSIGISVGHKDSDSGATAQAGNSSFRSVGDTSEGILMASTGRAIFNHNQFQLNDPKDMAILVGSRCSLNQNTNANERCQAPQ